MRTWRRRKARGGVFTTAFPVEGPQPLQVSTLLDDRPCRPVLVWCVEGLEWAFRRRLAFFRRGGAHDVHDAEAFFELPTPASGPGSTKPSSSIHRPKIKEGDIKLIQGSM